MKNFEIDITYRCNLTCKWCNRLCNTPFCKPIDMSLDMIKKYFTLMSEQVHPFSRIAILGGEPTLHPQFLEILNLASIILLPKLKVPILIISNGVSDYTRNILDEVKKIYYTVTTSCSNCVTGFRILKPQKNLAQFCLIYSKYKAEYKHQSIFRASIDLISPENFKRCWIRRDAGSGFTPYGIFPCAGPAVAISTIFNLSNVGLDHIPSEEEDIIQRYQICKYCYIPCEKCISTDITKTYEQQLQKWNQHPSFLTVLT